LIKSGGGGGSKTDRSADGGVSKAHAYTTFLEKRITECLDENKRYLGKYSDLRIFAYS